MENWSFVYDYNFRHKGEIIYRVELPDMEQITLIYLENNDADYRKSRAQKSNQTNPPSAIFFKYEKINFFYKKTSIHSMQFDIKKKSMKINLYFLQKIMNLFYYELNYYRYIFM